ncbi:MAG: antibiotic biosynthesis monooxygenase [Candidatus Nealsonbacteria bacterium]|nr:antibiotic biosynthesis monooxygenase [Candidatus Nealsonbacteria bacterium]
MISVLATIELAEGRRDDFLTAFGELVPKVAAEEGCIEYAPWIDAATEIDAQPELRSGTVVVVEKWESLDALQAHLMAPHMMEYRKAVKSMVTGTALQILEPA